jgi:MFS family permease
MIPLDLFRDRAFAAANLATFLIYFALSTVLFFLPMTLIAGWGTAGGLASAVFAPLSVFISTLSATSGRLADRFGPGRLIGAGGMIVALAFAGSPSASARRMSGSAWCPPRRSWASAWRWWWRRCRPRS